MVFLYIIIALVILITLYLQRPVFGAKPTGKRLDRMQASPHYKDGKFMNRSYTPQLTEGSSMIKVLYNFLFRRPKGTKPARTIPSVKTDLNDLPAGDHFVWFGHSSYFMQLNGMKILVDPVFSGNASPIPGSTKAFKGSDIYTVDDLPVIDHLIITHDHYDHLDFDTIKKLRPKVKQVICGLGVGSHLERWGYPSDIIIEMDWDEVIEIQQGVKLFSHTARHFSGRSFKRDGTLWMSFLLQTPTHKIYIGGDSGYDDHFKQIGDLHGPIDLAILENGQYNEAWKAIHFLPGENLQAAKELKAKSVLPVHSGKFDLALHDWDEPLKQIAERNKHFGMKLITPRIGERVDLNDHEQLFGEWWSE